MTADRLRRLALIGMLAASGAASAEPGVVWEKAQRSETEAAIIALIEDYVRALETKDVKLFRRVKPALSDAEEKRLQTAFASGPKQSIELMVRALEIADGKAQLKASRRDTISGGIVSSFPQSFGLEKQHDAWVITEIGRLGRRAA
jgi:hypothetical protein